MGKMMKYLVAIPIFNEEKTIASVLEKVSELVPHILVIDDGSTDRTPGILRQFPKVDVITHPENRGYGQSLIDAFDFARRNDFDWVITMDCDEQHEPEFISKFVDRFEQTDADIISGSRYLREFGSDDEPPADRRCINMTINSILHQILQLDLTDSFCGFKAHRVSALARLNLTEPGYAFPCQFWVQCVRTDLKIEELSVRRIYRDRSRKFGGTLDDPAARLQHYLEVLLDELRREPTPRPEKVAADCRDCVRDASTKS